MICTRFSIAVILSYTTPIVFSSSIEAQLEELSIGSDLALCTESNADETVVVAAIATAEPTPEAAETATTDNTTDVPIVALTDAGSEAPFTENFPDDVAFDAWHVSYFFLYHDHFFTPESVDARDDSWTASVGCICGETAGGGVGMVRGICGATAGGGFDAELKATFATYSISMNTTFAETLRYMRMHPLSDASVKVEAQFRRQVERLRSSARSMRSLSFKMTDPLKAMAAYAKWAKTIVFVADTLEYYADYLAEGNPPSTGLISLIPDHHSFVPCKDLTLLFLRNQAFSVSFIEDINDIVQELFEGMLSRVRRLVRDVKKNSLTEAVTAAESRISEMVSGFEGMASAWMDQVSSFEDRDGAENACTRWAGTIDLNLVKIKAEAEKLR